MVTENKDSITTITGDSSTVLNIDTGNIAPSILEGEIDLDSLCEARNKTTVIRDTIEVPGGKIIVYVEKNKLKIKAETDSLKQITIEQLKTIRWQKETITKYEKQERVIVEVEKPYTWWVKFCIWFTCIVIPVTGVGIYLKFRFKRRL